MSVAWEAMAARARGLATHLLSAEQLAGVERAEGVAEFTQRLRGTGYGPLLPQSREAGAGAVETALTRAFAERLTALTRWAGPDGVALRAFFLEQDARSLRALLRGIAGAQSPEQRVADALPTPLLDRRALLHLSRSESVGAVAGALVAWGHPFGSALLEEAGRAHADLFRLEVVLDRALAAAAVEAARSSGKRMRTFVAESIDARNVLAALVLAGSSTETAAEDVFVGGGEVLSEEDFAAAASAGNTDQAARVLRTSTSRSLFEGALGDPPHSPGVVASRIRTARIGRLEEERRTDPVSASPVLLFLMRARGESLRLRRALWNATLAGGEAA